MTLVMFILIYVMFVGLAACLEQDTFDFITSPPALGHRGHLTWIS